MAYSGSFKKTVAPDYAGTHPARLNWGTGADPGHANPEWGSDQGFPALKNPALPEVPTHVEDTYDPESAESPYFMPSDREPSGHDGYGPAPSRFNPYQEIANDYKRHDADYGADLKNTMPVVMRQYDQTYSSPREQSLPPSSGDGDSGVTGQALRALRGHNALAENNPGSSDVNFSGDYIRQGYEISRLADRRMPRRRLTHTKRDLHLNLASVAQETKPQSGNNYSPYSSPFNGAVGRVASGISAPMQRREPRPWDETAVTDGTEDSYDYDTDQYSSWGL